MAEASKKIQAIAQRIGDCLSEEGLEPQIEVREHEAIVAARASRGEALQVVAHIATRQFSPSNAAAVDAEDVRHKRAATAHRPTLEPRSAAGLERDAQREGEVRGREETESSGPVEALRPDD